MIVTRAPLRIPLGGGGTDFPSYYLEHGGYILGFALNKYVHVVLQDTIDGKIRLKYSKNEVVEDVEDLENRVAAEALKWHGVTSGIEIATFSDVPESSGLGGSSSFCVALVTALRQKLGQPLVREEIFASAYDIERNKAGQPGGIQDQFFATYGNAWSIYLEEEGVSKSIVDVSGLLPSLSLVYTNTGRTDLSIAERQTARTASSDSEILDNLGSVKTMGKWAEDLLTQGRNSEVGELLHRHWEVKKRRDPAVTNPIVDSLYSSAREAGAQGGKLLGLGGGGYLLLYSETPLDGLNCIPVGLDTEGCKVVYCNG